MITDERRDTRTSPTVTFYNGDTALGNAMGSMADREGNNSGRKQDKKEGSKRGQA